MSASPEIQAFLSSLDMVLPLNPRDAFFWETYWCCFALLQSGRTQGEEIRDVDVTSEYPWLNKYGMCPVALPTILFEPEDHISSLSDLCGGRGCETHVGEKHVLISHGDATHFVWYVVYSRNLESP